MNYENIACIFPGQVIIKEDFFEEISKAKIFTEMYELLCHKLNIDLFQLVKNKEFEILNKNEISSLLSVLAGCVEYDDFCKNVKNPNYFAGYSVGQWTALYAAGYLNFERLINIVKIRAEIMNKFIALNPSSMISVIGVSEKLIKQSVEKLQLQNHFVEISNYNCFGQYTLSVKKASIEVVMNEFKGHAPRKLLLLPMSGGWHSSLLNEAAFEFLEFLNTLELLPLKTPVIDKVTGIFLPSDGKELKSQLAKHICSPVLWEEGINTLIKSGCKNCFEVGYGNTLTKFGFFINRSIKHVSYMIK